jgi:hypothetical protein
LTPKVDAVPCRVATVVSGYDERWEVRCECRSTSSCPSYLYTRHESVRHCSAREGEKKGNRRRGLADRCRPARARTLMEMYRMVRPSQSLDMREQHGRARTSYGAKANSCLVLRGEHDGSKGVLHLSREAGGSYCRKIGFSSHR